MKDVIYRCNICRESKQPYDLFWVSTCVRQNLPHELFRPERLDDANVHICQPCLDQLKTIENKPVHKR